MRYAFKLKNGAMALFDPETALLSITTPHGDVQSSTIGRAESRLLDLLLMEPGQTKSREEIIDYTWNDRVVASGSLNQAVFSLRNLLNDSRDHEILMTVPRRGYCFNRQYVVDAQTDLPVPKEETAQRSAPIVEEPAPALGRDQLPMATRRGRVQHRAAARLPARVRARQFASGAIDADHCRRGVRLGLKQFMEAFQSRIIRLGLIPLQ